MSFPRYERYKAGGIGWLSEVPAHWQVMPNKAFLSATNDLVGSNSSQFTLLSLTLFGVIVRDIESGKGKFPAEFDSYKAVEVKDLIFCLFDLDETPRTIGLANNAGMITGAYEVLRCRPLAVPSYVYYFYLHVDGFKGLRPWYTGLRKVVRPDTFMSIKLALPPLDEQKQISLFLDKETAKIDALIAEQRRLIELLKEKRQAVISHAVTKGLRRDAPVKESGIEWLGSVPSHWPILILKRVFSAMDYGISESLDSEGAVAILRMGNIQDGKVVMDDLKYIDAVDPTLILRRGDLLYNRTNSLDLIGKVGMFTGIHRQPVSFASYLVRLRTGDKSNPAYFAYLLNTDGILALARSDAFVAIGQCNLNPTRYSQTLIALPPKPEQDEIAQYLDKKVSDLNVLTTEAEVAVKLLQERRSALISAAVTGKIDVRNYTPKEAA